MPTPADPQTAIDALIASIRRIMASCGQKKIEGVGISLPGRFNPTADRLVFAPNLKWRDVDIRGPIARGDRTRGGARECRQCVRAGGGVVRPDGRGPQPRGGHGLRRHRHGNPGEWAARARSERDGRRVRTRSDRSERPGLRLRQPRVLGGVRVESRGAALLRRVRRRLGGRLVRRPAQPRRSRRCSRGEGAGDDGASSGARHADDRGGTLARAHHRDWRPDTRRGGVSGR